MHQLHARGPRLADRLGGDARGDRAERRGGARAAPSAPSNRPNTVGPGAGDDRVLGARRRAAAASAVVDRRAQRAGGGLEVVDGRGSAPPARARRGRARARRGVRGRAEAVELAVDRAAWRARASSGTTRAASGSAAGSGSTCSPAPVISARPGASMARRRRRRAAAASAAAARRRAPAACGGEPQRGGGVGRAAAHARRRPGSACRSSAAAAAPSQPGRRAERRERARRRGSRPRRPGRRPRRRRRAGSSVELVGERRRLDERDERVQAVLARARRRSRQRLTLPGREARSLTRSALAQRAPVARARASRRARRRVAERLERGARARRGCPARRRARARASAASALRRWAKPRWTSARSAGSAAPGRGARRPTSTESTFGTGWNTVRGTGRRTRTSHASWASTDGDAVGATCPARAASRSPTSRCTIATQRVDVGQLLDRAQDHGRRDAVGQVRDDLGRRRVERREVELDRVGEVQRGVRRAGRARRAARGSSAAVELDDVDVRDALGEVLATARRGRRRPRARRRPRPSSAARAITSSMFESIRKFWPSSRFGRMPNALQAAQARLRRELAHQPNSARGVRLDRRLELLVGDPAPLGDEARGVDDVGRLVALPCARPAASGTARRSPPAGGRAGTCAAASARSLRLRVGDVAGERDPPAALEALLEPVGHREAVQDHLEALRRRVASVAIVSSSAARVWMTSGLPASRASSICAANARSWSARGA